MITNIALRTGALPVLAFAVLTVAGCASGQPPRAELGGARASIATAERAGAAERAPVELNNARTKLQAAEDASRQENYRKAERLAEEANIDAQLATTKAQAASSEAALQEVNKGITTLRSETAPTSPAGSTAPTTPPSRGSTR